MKKIKLYSKLVSLILIVTVLFTACDVPDISKFTEQSAEMTRGIRKGVKDTESLIKGASERDDLYNSEQLNLIKTNLVKYQIASKPTLKVLDSLDAYLEALNTLSQANKKSEENSKAVVDSVSNLVTAVSGIQLAGTAVNVAAGLLTLAEEFRTSKDFKKRVNLASIIIEGETDEVFNAQTNERILIKPCTKEAIDGILAGGGSDGEKAEKIAKKKCGVIDLLKFNIAELKIINNSISDRLFTDFRSQHTVIINLYKQLNANNANVQEEMDRILNFQRLSILVKEDYETNSTNSVETMRKVKLKDDLKRIASLDPILGEEIRQELINCGNNCQAAREILEFDEFSCPVEEDTVIDACSEAGNQNKCICRFYTRVKNLSEAEFDAIRSRIAPKLEERYKKLSAKLDSNNADLLRINPAYSKVIAEVKLIKDKQEQLDSLLDSSVDALNAWADTHANLRVAVNTKKPLSISRLVSKVREIWEIIDKPSAN